MEPNVLTAISPLDGRYASKVENLRAIFSEYGLMKYRIIVEIRWLEMLANSARIPEIPNLTKQAQGTLNSIIDQFTLEDAARVKAIEAEINHDVKSIEYFIKEKIEQDNELEAISEFIHFGCTSEDINNLAYSMMLDASREQVMLPMLDEVVSTLKHFAHNFAGTAMLARTHGQPATPTTVGKEIANVVARLQRQIKALKQVNLTGKMNGATGNYNALALSHPEIDWRELSEKLVTTLGLEWNPYTTQIEPHDSMAELFAVMLRINNILIDFCRDTWSYISINYFKQKAVAKEVGSSTMPHKVNPIDFENAEGNLGVANALFEHMMTKLPISRWQRDLSDSTVLRNVGVAFAHSAIAYQSALKGLAKLEPNLNVIADDLNGHWEVLAEAIQTIMRRHKLEKPYEQLKTFTRGKQVTQDSLREFITTLDMPDRVKEQLLALTPDTYIGYAEELAKQI